MLRQFLHQVMYSTNLVLSPSIQVEWILIVLIYETSPNAKPENVKQAKIFCENLILPTLLYGLPESAKVLALSQFQFPNHTKKRACKTCKLLMI